jgi:hypothetical protein
MQTKVLLVTPPFTQLNTPYPATAYLKGFLNTKNIAANQADLGIEVILALFSKKGLQQLFEQFEEMDAELEANTYRIYNLREAYLQTIDPVDAVFAKQESHTLAHAICDRTYSARGIEAFPQLGRFGMGFWQLWGCKTRRGTWLPCI